MDSKSFRVAVLMPDGEAKDSFLTPDVISFLTERFTFTNYNAGRGFPKEELLRVLDESDAVITGWGSPFLGDGITSGHRVKLIAHTGGTVADIVDGSVYESGVAVSSGNTLFAESVAEGTMAYITAALRRIPDDVAAMREGVWDYGANYTRGLFDRTVGIIGLGAISRVLIELLLPFRVKILISSSHTVDPEYLGRIGGEQVEMTELFSRCDVISLHSALTDKTRGTIGKELLSLMKDGALFVNTARGAIVRENELIEVLREGKIFAVLDVFEKEPLDNSSPLRTMKNVYLLPHKAGPTLDRRRYIGRAIAEEIVRLYKNEPLCFSIQKEQASRMTRHKK